MMFRTPAPAATPGAGTGRLEAAGEWILRLSEDDLSEEELQRWLEWCEADPENLAAFEKMQSLWQRIPPEAAVPLPARTRAPGWKIAATVLVGSLLVGLAILMIGDTYGRRGRITVHLEAPDRANEHSVLPDGSQVALGAGSALAVEFTASQRDLNMPEGTAFFKVKPDQARPFVVHAGPVSVTALGTSFNIRRNGKRVVVTVNEGVVQISRETSRAGGNSLSSSERAASEWNELRAKAGYRLTYDAGSDETRLEPTDPAAELAWQEGELVYNNEPLQSVLENVNRYARQPVELADPALGQLRFTGTVFVRSIDTWISALPAAFPVTLSRKGSRVWLEARDAARSE